MTSGAQDPDSNTESPEVPDPAPFEPTSISLASKSDGAGGSLHELIERIAEHTPPNSRYQHEGEIGRGGMGAILRVWDADLRRHLAMKVVLGKGGSESLGATTDAEAQLGRCDDPRMLGRFLEEAQVTGQLEHPGIVPVHELGLDAEGRLYFTMKLVKGQTLKEVFDELARGAGGWTRRRVLGVILKVCEAMSYAHAKGVIHRDLKPDNIMVGGFGEVYVMDWGLAKILGRDDEQDLLIRDVSSDRQGHAGDTPDSPLYTMDGDVVGTPVYMSPEQAAGRVSEMGPQSDVYAVGAMLYQLLAGHMPFVPPKTALNNLAVLQELQAGPPRPLAEVAAGASPDLVAVCEKAMAREQDARYASMSELMESLLSYLDRGVFRARHSLSRWVAATSWILGLMWGVLMLAWVAILVMAGVFTFAPGSEPDGTDGQSGFTWTVAAPFSYEEESPSTSVTSNAAWLSDVTLGERTAELTLSMEGWVLGLLTVLLGGTVLFAITFVIYQMRRVFKALRTGSPFVADNVARIRKIAFTLIALSIGRTVLSGVTAAILLRSVDFEGLRVTNLFQIEFAWLLSGLLTLIVAEVFRIGVELEGRRDDALAG